MTITRREAVRGATIALALAPIPAAAVAALPAAASDAELVRLEAELNAASDAFEAACVALDRAEGALWLRDGDGEVLDLTISKFPAVLVADCWYCGSEEEIARYCQPINPKGPTPAERDELIKRLQQAQEAQGEAREQAGLGPFEDARDDAEERWEAAREAIAEAQAQSLAGLLIKARLVSKDLSGGAAHAGEEIAESLVADLERLAGRA